MEKLKIPSKRGKFCLVRRSTPHGVYSAYHLDRHFLRRSKSRQGKTLELSKDPRLIHRDESLFGIFGLDTPIWQRFSHNRLKMAVHRPLWSPSQKLQNLLPIVFL